MSNFITKPIIKLVNNLTSFIDHDEGQLKHLPNFIIYLSLWVSISNILQTLADYTLEILSILHLLPFKIAFNPEYLFLLTIGAILAKFNLEGLRRKEIDVSKNGLNLAFIVESAILCSDIFLITSRTDNLLHIYSRIPFMILTSINIVIVTYTIFKLHFFEIHIPHIPGLIGAYTYIIRNGSKPLNQFRSASRQAYKQIANIPNWYGNRNNKTTKPPIVPVKKNYRDHKPKNTK